MVKQEYQVITNEGVLMIMDADNTLDLAHQLDGINLLDNVICIHWLGISKD
jgi:hypothetical protein